MFSVFPEFYWYSHLSENSLLSILLIPTSTPPSLNSTIKSITLVTFGSLSFLTDFRDTWAFLDGRVKDAFDLKKSVQEVASLFYCFFGGCRLPKYFPFLEVWVENV